MEGLNVIDILVIGDNSDETTLIAKIIDNNWNINFNSVKDGIEAMEYLHKKGRYKDNKTPSLILLDLNLPKKSGLEILKEIKTDNALKYIPVIILTISTDDENILESYKYHANAYMSKHDNLDKFIEEIYIFNEFWFNNVKLPQIE